MRYTCKFFSHIYQIIHHYYFESNYFHHHYLALSYGNHHLSSNNHHSAIYMSGHLHPLRQALNFTYHHCSLCMTISYRYAVIKALAAWLQEVMSFSSFWGGQWLSIPYFYLFMARSIVRNLQVYSLLKLSLFTSHEDCQEWLYVVLE